MHGKMAIVDFRRCEPESCNRGECVAVAACPRKLLVQEAPYEAPMTNPSICKGCGDCVRACPLKAIMIV
jgi:translation initiation factor RLI1